MQYLKHLALSARYLQYPDTPTILTDSSHISVSTAVYSENTYSWMENTTIEINAPPDQTPLSLPPANLGRQAVGVEVPQAVAREHGIVELLLRGLCFVS